MNKYVCIHGHFYQPPRENPWLESVELQDSAAPYHDWNERIAVECYAPNAFARIMDGENRIREIVSNYSRMSFNFGPTLLAWMQDKMPAVHNAIVTADRQSRERYSGHGSAIAQVYNHMILPLANNRDKQTQVIWGVRDFEHRFGRAPEGMWLAETAADSETLAVLAQHGIKFTILSPFQASRYREIGKKNWRDANGGKIDPTRPYLVRLPKGQSITIFFYDAPVSQAVAFEQLLVSGERFANRLMSAFDDARNCDQLVHIGTDGESYGHHHRHGEMALAYAMQFIETNHLATLTNYGEFLEKHPPTYEAQIHEKSAWSCSHGVGRWMTDCGCNSGGHGGWNQAWRGPLRETLDWLRDTVEPHYERVAAEFLKDPWDARNDYIHIVLDRGPENLQKFFERNATRPLNPQEQVQVLKLLELQRHAMLMYTSCGWFFDELSGIETVQVIQYAARVLQLAREVFDQDLEPGFLERLGNAKSNIPENKDGRVIFEKFVKPAMIDWNKATAHYAVSSVFKDYPEKTRIFSYTFQDEHRQLFSSGKTRVAVGRTRVLSEITHESYLMTHAMLYMGEHNLTGGVREFRSAEAYETLVKEIKAAYDMADFPLVIRTIDKHFGESAYSLKSLFKDEQRRILNEIMSSTHEDLEGRFRLITERYEPLMKFLRGAGVPLPPALETAADFVLHSELRCQFEAETLSFEGLSSLLEEAKQRGARVLDSEISYVVKNRLEQTAKEVAAAPDDLDKMRELGRLADLVMPLPLGLNVAETQNTYWGLLQLVGPEHQAKAGQGDANARVWVEQFLDLGRRLGFALKDTAAAEPMKAAA